MNSRRLLLTLPLLTLAPLGAFLGEYLDGFGLLPYGIGFVASAASMLILPWMVAALFLTVPKIKVMFRGLLFIGALGFQGLLLFALVPPGATSEMMGFAHRLRWEFSVDDLRSTAEEFRSKFESGTLEVSQEDADDYFVVFESAKCIPDAELPNSLRGRFQRVLIQQDPTEKGLQVFFALDRTRGIVCDNRKVTRGLFEYSMAEGVHAYHYQRL